MEQVYLFLYFIGIVVELLIRIPYNQETRKIERVHKQVAGTEPVILLALWLGIIILPFIWGATPWLDFANYNWPIAAVNPAGNLGLLFLGLAIGLMWKAHQDLGRNWSSTLEILRDHQLVTRGIYGVIRHPMYTSHLVWGIAQMLMVHNWIAGAASLVTFLLIYFLRIPAEEKMMLEHFGDEYRAYCQRTGRIIPRLRQILNP